MSTATPFLRGARPHATMRHAPRLLLGQAGFGSRKLSKISPKHRIIDPGPTGAPSLRQMRGPLASSHGCALQSRDVQLDHVHHRGEDAAGDGRVGVGEKTGQSLGHNLPRDAPPVAQPAAHDFRPTVGGEGCPQPIDLCLICTED